MAYHHRGLRMLSATDALRWFAYETVDPIATVTAAGYFDRLHGARTNDLISVTAVDATALLRIAVTVTGATSTAAA